MIVVELDVVPSDAMILYYKDDGPIVLTKELRFYQKFKHIEQGYMRLHRAIIHRDIENRLHMGYSRPKLLSQPKIEACL